MNFFKNLFSENRIIILSKDSVVEKRVSVLKKITTFFKQLANDKLGGDSDLKHFSFKTIMDIMRRKNLLKAFLSKNPEEKKEGEKVLKAYSEMLQKRKNK